MQPNLCPHRDLSLREHVASPLDELQAVNDLYVLYDGRALYTGTASAAVFEAWDRMPYGAVREAIDWSYADQACCLYAYDMDDQGHAGNERLLYHQTPETDTAFTAWRSACVKGDDHAA